MKNLCSRIRFKAPLQVGVTVLVGLFGLVHPAFSAVAGSLEVHVLDVGQADAVLVRCPDGTHEILIDSADTRYPGSSVAFKTALQGLQATLNTLEYVVASHPHADHIGNMRWVFQKYKVKNYIDNGYAYDSATYTSLMTTVHSEAGCVYRGVATSPTVPTISLCAGVTVRILRPAGFEDPSDNPNDRSVILRVDYGKTSFLFVGDAEEDEEQMLLNDVSTKNLLAVNFLKVPHHGSDTSSSVAFINKVKPKISVVSCGAYDPATNKGVGTNLGYKHPRRSTVKRLLTKADARQGAPVTIWTYDKPVSAWVKEPLKKAVYATPGDGPLFFTSDGEKIVRNF